MELFGWLFGASMGSLGLAIGLFALVAPLLWLWMLIDAVLREEWEYPGATPTSNNRLLWVLLILLANIAAIPYFFMVFSKIKRGTVPRPGAAVPAQP